MLSQSGVSSDLRRSRLPVARVAANWLLKLSTLLITLVYAIPSLAQVAEHGSEATGGGGAAPPVVHHGGEASLVVPKLGDTHIATFMGGMPGSTLLMGGIGVAIAGMLFALVIYSQLKNLPVHKSMLEISELIYETCKTYLVTQIKFIMILEAFIGAIIVYYFGVAQHYFSEGKTPQVLIILVFSLIGIAGSCAVAWFGIRVNTFANSRTAFAALRGKPFPCYAIPLKAGMSIGMLLISVELVLMLGILLFVPGEYAGPCFIGFAIGESLGASALRIAGGIFTKIADIGSDLMKIAFKIKEDDARNPGVIADCTGDNAGDSVGPSADGFETYGVTGVALISFILLAVHNETVQVQLLVWIFVMRIVMVIASVLSYFINDFMAKSKHQNADKMNFESPLTILVILTSVVSVALTFIVSKQLIPGLSPAELDAAKQAGLTVGHGIGIIDQTLWWKLSLIITCGTAAGAIIPELIKVFTSTESGHVKEVVTSSREGGASLNILSGLTAGNYSAYWMGIVLIFLMGTAYMVSKEGVGSIMMIGNFDPSAVFAFGLVAFGFLGMGPVTIAVDSYGPVTDNAQSVYELSLIENVPDVKNVLKKEFGFDVQFEKAKHALEENDGAGNTFKATAKPVLIGTAVVGATTMIFAIIVTLTNGFSQNTDKISLLYPPFLLGLIAGGAVIYWFTGASTQAVTTGAYRAVEFIKANIKLEGVEKASAEDSKKVVEICTIYAQKGMFNIFLVIFFSTLAFAFYDSFFFIGYLIAIALFGLFQALFMANAGGAWDNAKKVVEVELKMKGTELHDASVVGDTVGDPFKDTSSVALNPVIKFTTLFGLLAVELAEQMKAGDKTLPMILAAVFFGASVIFVYRSFYGMRINTNESAESNAAKKAEA
ncbi:MAG: sodium-translocating pyrophosphatase [Labilithrix sp.]